MKTIEELEILAATLGPDCGNREAARLDVLIQVQIEILRALKLLQDSAQPKHLQGRHR